MYTWLALLHHEFCPYSEVAHTEKVPITQNKRHSSTARLSRLNRVQGGTVMSEFKGYIDSHGGILMVLSIHFVSLNTTSLTAWMDSASQHSTDTRVVEKLGFFCHHQHQYIGSKMSYSLCLVGFVRRFSQTVAQCSSQSLHDPHLFSKPSGNEGSLEQKQATSHSHSRGQSTAAPAILLENSRDQSGIQHSPGQTILIGFPSLQSSCVPIYLSLY